MNRRSFLSRSMLSAASFGVGSALPFGRAHRFGIRSAEAAGLPTPYPVLQIHVNGGWDPAMQMVAIPNGSFGTVQIENRMPGASSFKTTTKSKITYVTSVVTPFGKTDFEPHLEDVALIRAMEGPSDHFNIAGPWFGRVVGTQLDSRFGKLSWASQLAAQFRKRGFIVPKPVAVAYQNFNAEVMKTQPYRDLVAWGTQSPDPTTLADRITSLSGYFDSIAATGLPLPGVQLPAYDLIDALDQMGPTATQPEYANRFLGANKGTSEVLRRASGKSAWPPSPDVLGKLGLSAASVTKEPDLLGRSAPYEHMFALAYQALANNLAHVIAYRTAGIWDSHIDNVGRQTAAGNAMWPALGKLITLMKGTQSPIDPTPGVSLFDTTIIWLQSEIGRSPDHQPETKDIKTTDGTKHWSTTSAVLMGGRLKRGIAIGGHNPKFHALPINLVTGNEAGGTVVGIENVMATVMKAAGGDPSEYTNAPPIDFLLDMSRF